MALIGLKSFMTAHYKNKLTSPHETADAKAMRDKARVTFVRLIALMEAEFLAPRKLKHLPDSARSHLTLPELPAAWFSKPVDGWNWVTLNAEAQATFDDYYDLLFCLHAVRQFKINMAALQGAENTRNEDARAFSDPVQQEVHKLQSSIVTLALQQSHQPLAGTIGILSTESKVTPKYAQQPYAYQVKGRATDISLDCWDAADDLEKVKQYHASGYIPRLVVFDDTPSPRLTAYIEAYQKYGGEIFLGDLAWEHVHQHANKNLWICIDRYCRNPLRLVSSATDLDPKPHGINAIGERGVPSWANSVLGRC
ncbi:MULTISPECIES: hypothetical protein [unclassified Sulfitobacter]|uniref:hypothetical protein n=2 Tax=Sulfitobacter TaxID=60136 RepID=UPI00374713C5